MRVRRILHGLTLAVVALSLSGCIFAATRVVKAIDKHHRKVETAKTFRPDPVEAGADAVPLP